jgi:hypothetical protein
VAFVYSPVSSKQTLPIFDRVPLGIWVGQTNEGGKTILWFCNIHWLLEQPKLLTAFMKYRKNGLVMNSKSMKERAIAQMVQIASSSPQRCLRKYRADKVSNWHRLTTEEEEQMFKLFGPQFRRNQNDRYIG